MSLKGILVTAMAIASLVSASVTQPGNSER